jgi:hypothetical protein
MLGPAPAVIQGADGARVWVVSNNQVSSRTVDTGPQRGEQVEIRRGLEGGESVVVSAPAGLKDGARVRVKS